MPRGQVSIQAFGQISKPHSETSTSKKRKGGPDTIQLPAVDAGIKKRKMRSIAKRQAPIDSGTSAIDHKLASLEITRLSPTPSTRRPARRTASPIPFEDTPPTSPCPSNGTEQLQTGLPLELEDFLVLNSAMLAALSLHYAHHGTASPLDIKQLLPSVTRIWGKRTVTDIDVKRCLGLLERCGKSPFQLFDYGHSKICIEFQEEKTTKRMGTQFDKDRLNQLFDQQLQQTWTQACESDDVGDPAAFIEALNFAEVKVSPTASKTAQSIALKRGQKRLEEVLGPRDDDTTNKPSKRRRMQCKEQAPLSAEDTSKLLKVEAPRQNLAAAPAQASSRADSLLDRIRAKQMHAASLPARPTKDQLDRIAALQRVEEVMSILDLLVAAKGQGPRASFSLPSLVQNIQNSLRSPMAKEEAERCLVVMEKEVAVGYVKCLRMGSMSGVVVDTGAKPRRDVLLANLKAAGI